jgi:hypothetical protein
MLDNTYSIIEAHVLIMINFESIKKFPAGWERGIPALWQTKKISGLFGERRVGM